MLNQALVLKSRVSSAFAITDVENLKVWYKFNTAQTTITDGIQWGDSSGNNNHARQTIDAQEGSGFSGGGFVTNSNNDNLDFSTTFTESGDYHLFMVLDLSEETNETFISSVDSTSFMRFGHGGTSVEPFRMKHGGTLLDITLSSGFGTTKAIAEVSRNGSNLVRVAKNGSSLGSGTGSGTFGFEQLGTTSNSISNATIFEVVIFSSILSTADATKVRNDIADRNSISL